MYAILEQCDKVYRIFSMHRDIFYSMVMVAPLYHNCVALSVSFSVFILGPTSYFFSSFHYVCMQYILQNHLKRLQTTFMNFLAETNGI